MKFTTGITRYVLVFWGLYLFILPEVGIALIRLCLQSSGTFLLCFYTEEVMYTWCGRKWVQPESSEHSGLSKRSFSRCSTPETVLGSSAGRVQFHGAGVRNSHTYFYLIMIYDSIWYRYYIDASSSLFLTVSLSLINHQLSTLWSSSLLVFLLVPRSSQKLITR